MILRIFNIYSLKNYPAFPAFPANFPTFPAISRFFPSRHFPPLPAILEISISKPAASRQPAKF